MTRMPKTAAAAVTLLASAALITACGQKREAEVDTGAAEAEVSTSLPESQVSDAQLKAAAEGAAAVAETPQGSNTSVVVTPPPTTGNTAGATSAGTPAPAPK